MSSRREATLAALGERGPVAASDFALHIASIILWLATASMGAGSIGVVAWAFTGYAEGLRFSLGFVTVFAIFASMAAAIAWVGAKIWIIEADRLTLHRLDSEDSICFERITGLRWRRIPIGRLIVHSPATAMSVSTQFAGFDEFSGELRSRVPHAELSRAGSPKPPKGQAKAPTTTAAVDRSSEVIYRVRRSRPRLVLGGLGLLLAFLVIGPWFVVEGEHPVRDGFIFTGVGSGLWALFGGLLIAEEFARDQPAELHLGPQGLAWRKFGERTLTRRSIDIMYVRNVPAYRHPLVLTFTDGERLTIDQLRATRFGSSRHHLAHEIRQRYMSSAHRTDAQLEKAEAWTTTAQNLDAEGEAAAAADAFRRAIASYPDHTRLVLHCHVGDLLRSISNHQSAVSSYRAHLDFAPSDSAAWQGLIAAYTALGRKDLASEATEAAGQSSMRRHVVTGVIDRRHHGGIVATGDRDRLGIEIDLESSDSFDRGDVVGDGLDAVLAADA